MSSPTFNPLSHSPSKIKLILMGFFLSTITLSLYHVMRTLWWPSRQSTKKVHETARTCLVAVFFLASLLLPALVGDLGMPALAVPWRLCALAVSSVEAVRHDFERGAIGNAEAPTDVGKSSQGPGRASAEDSRSSAARQWEFDAGIKRLQQGSKRMIRANRRVDVTGRKVLEKYPADTALGNTQYLQALLGAGESALKAAREESHQWHLFSLINESTRRDPGAAARPRAQEKRTVAAQANGKKAAEAVTEAQRLVDWIRDELARRRERMGER